MVRMMLRLAAVAVVVGASPVAAAKKPGWPVDLAQVPARSNWVISVQVAKVWGSEPAKVFRTAMGKQLDPFLTEFRSWTGTTPDEVERLTVALVPDHYKATDYILIARMTKRIDAKKTLPVVVREGKEEKIAGQAVYIGRTHGACIAADGKTLVKSSPVVIKALLKEKPGKAGGELGVVLRLATSHDVVFYTGPGASPIPDEAELAFPAKTTAAWLDVGYTTKFELRGKFADEKSATTGLKSLQSLRAVVSTGLSRRVVIFVKRSKPLTTVLAKIEKALGGAKIERKEAEFTASFEVKLDKKLADEAIKALAANSLRAQGQKNLSQIGLALWTSADAVGTFPPAATYSKDGKPLLSWRVHLLPYLGQEKLYKEFKLDEPWDSPHNKKLIARIPPQFSSPGRKPSAPGGTFFQAVVGKGAAFEGKRGIRLDDFEDGWYNTLLVAEAAKDVPWTKPEDLTFVPDGKLPKFGATGEDGFFALMADGSVHLLKATIKPATLKAMITRAGGETIED
jgi:hypothetical protein